MPIPFKQGVTAQLYDSGTTATGGQVLGTFGLNGQLNFQNVAIGEGGIPVGVANTGSTTAAGIVTLGTALPRIYPAIWLWFPAAVVTGDATGGFYFCVMTSTTVGQIFLTPGKVGLATGVSVVTLPFQPSFPVPVYVKLRTMPSAPRTIRSSRPVCVTSATETATLLPRPCRTGQGVNSPPRLFWKICSAPA